MQKDESIITFNETKISPNFVDLIIPAKFIEKGTIIDSIQQEKKIYQNDINRKKQKFYGRIRARRINK